MKTSYFLYAEDDEDDVDILLEALRGCKKKVVLISVADGFELLKYLQKIAQNESYPVLIILDLNLPRLDGVETLQLLRTDDFFRLIPVVMFTSEATDSQAADCNRLGAEVLIKPSGFKEWSHVIDHFYSYVEEE